jgi:hypothetical protein
VPLHRRMEHSVKPPSQRVRAPRARARARSRSVHARLRAEACRQRGVGVLQRGVGVLQRGVGVLQRGALRQVCVPEAWPLRRMDSHLVVRPSPFEAVPQRSLPRARLRLVQRQPLTTRAKTADTSHAHGHTPFRAHARRRSPAAQYVPRAHVTAAVDTGSRHAPASARCHAPPASAHAYREGGLSIGRLIFGFTVYTIIGCAYNHVQLGYRLGCAAARARRAVWPAGARGHGGAAVGCGHSRLSVEPLTRP